MTTFRPEPSPTAPLAAAGDPLRPVGSLDDLVCDVEAGLLSTRNDSVNIGPRGARILDLLLARRGEVLSFAVLIEAGWQGYTVEESSLAVEVASLRQALTRLLGPGNWIAVIARRGYRLSPTADAGRPRLPGRWETPTIGVLPITPDDGALAAIAAELTRRVTETLSLHAGLSVSPAHLAGLVTAQDGASDLGLRHLLQGQMHETASGLSIHFSLTDVALGCEIWSEGFLETPPIAPARLDRLAAELVQQIDILLIRGTEAVIGYPPTRNLTAWSHYIRGLGHAYWPRDDMLWGQEVQMALAEWRKALALDPESADLLATIGAGHAVLAAYPATLLSAEHAEAAGRYLHAALERDPDHPVALAFHAMMLSELDRYEVAAEVARRAIRLAPSAPAVTAVAAVALCAAGYAAEAVEAVERTLAVTPHFPSIYTPPLARAWRDAGRVEDAIRFLEALNEEPHKFDGRELILGYMQAGRHVDAVNVATQLLLLEPGFTISGWLATQHRADQDAVARDTAALRAVGLPE